MTDARHQQRIAHDEAQQLLPWLVNETLDADARARLLTHLGECLVCRRDLSAQRELRTMVRESPTLEISPARGFDALIRDLGSDPDLRGRPSADGHAADASRRPRWIALAAGLAFASIGAWLLLGPADDAPPALYRTVTQPGTLDATIINAVFERGTTAGEIRAIVAGAGGRIVTGPGEDGIYTIELETPEAGLANLRGQSQVRFLGPAITAEDGS